MAAINQPVGHALTVRDAAAACRLSPRTLRRKLTAGAFPNAYKTGPDDDEREGIWMIPPGDLEAAGLSPTLVHPTLTKAVTTQPEPEPESDGPTVLELVRSDRFGRLRAELAEAVAAAEIALLRVEAERWRVLADERAQALDRADTALRALATAIGTPGMIGAGAAQPAMPPAPMAPAAMTAPAPDYSQPPAAPAGPRMPPNDIVAVPPLVRAEAMRYTASLRALHEMRRPQNKWWQFWKA